MKNKKFIIGGGISGLIFAYYNPDYVVISPDLGGKLRNDYLTSTILLHDTPETKKLLDDLNLVLEPKTHVIKYFYKNKLLENIPSNLKEIMVAKKLTNWSNLNDFAYPTEISDLTLSTKDIYIPIYKTAISKIVRLLSKDMQYIKDKVIRITKDEIITERTRFEYDELISTIPAPIFWKLYGQEKNLKFTPGSFVVSNNTPLESEKSYWDLIYFVDKNIPYTRVNKYNHSSYLYEFTGEITGEQVKSLLPNFAIDHLYVDNFAIINTDLNNIPPPKVRFIGRFASWDHAYKIQHVIRESLTHCDFMSVWNKQKEFNANFFDFNIKDVEKQQKLTKDFILHLEDEAHELLQTINWKMNLYKSNPINREHLMEEWVDIFKFWLGLGNVWGISPEEFFYTFWKKSEIVDERYKRYIKERNKN